MNCSGRAVPWISVVVPSYNQGRFLRANLESIFRQEYPHLEVVVVDGGSTDESLAIIQSFAPRLKFWRSRPDDGQSAAINEGIEHCTGELVAWLNSDDYYWGNCLWTVAAAYAAYPDFGLYIGNGLRYSQQQDRYTIFTPRHLALNRKALAEGLDYLFQPATFIARSAWQEVGGLNPDLRYCMDWDLFLRVARTYPAVLINEVLAVSREHQQTKTSTGQLGRIHEIVNMVRRHTSQEITPGGLYYLFETLLDLTEMPVRYHVHECMKVLRARWQQQVGSPDGFPEKGDSQDRTYLPFAERDAVSGPAGDSRNLPTVSVVVPSFNQAEFLPQTLDSLLGQHYPRLETVVIDGGSSDGSQDVIRRYEDQLAGWVSEPDRGPAHAINKGLARTRGEVVAWLNSDDVLADGAIREAARLFAEDPELDLVYGNALYIDEHNRLFLADHGTCRTGLYYGDMQPVERIPQYWSYVHAVPQPTVFFRRRLLDRCGGLDESYHYTFDFELFFRFAQTAKIKKLERTQAFYRIHARAKTASWAHFLVELYRFSRPRWPSRFSPEFLPVLLDFVRNYLSRHYHGHSKWRRRAKGLRVAFSAWTGLGNPEAAGLAVKRRIIPPLPLAPAAPTPPTEDYCQPIERRSLVYRTFFCSFNWPMHPGFSGGEIRDFHLLRHLLTFSQVSYYSYTGVPNDGRADPLARHMECVQTSETIQRSRSQLVNPNALVRSRTSRLLERLRCKGWPVLGPRYHSNGTEKLPSLQASLVPALQADLDQQEPDFLFIAPQVNPTAMLLAHTGPRTRVILASYDVEAIRIARLGAARRSWVGQLAGYLEARRAERFERDNLEFVDGIIAVSPLDRDLFVQSYQFPPERVLVLPNAVDPNYFAFTERQPGTGKMVVFTASMGYEPNAQAALRLVDRIMPLVRRQHPEAVVWIVGKDPSARVEARHDGARVVVTGEVADVRPYLAAAAVSCVPLLTGSGTKYKVLEALSAGVPVVCSPVGVEGLDLAHEEHLLIGRTDEELADAVCRVLSDPMLSTRLAAQGRLQVERFYNWDVSVSGLRPWLAHVARLPRRSATPLMLSRSSAPAVERRAAA